jgi:GNAT superfamily N-acetyltransferase
MSVMGRCAAVWSEDGVRLVAYDRESPLLERALEVYARVWPDRDREEAREGFPRYAGYAGFHGLVAFDGDEPVGTGYGANSVPGIWWHDQTAAIIGGDHPALQDAWRLVELAVVAEYRGQGGGGRIHDTLIAAQPCPHLLLCTGVWNTAARQMYLARGWQVVADDLTYPGQPHPYVVMARAAPRRSG